jgi:chromosome segregation ATPase
MDSGAAKKQVGSHLLTSSKKLSCKRMVAWLRKRTLVDCMYEWKALSGATKKGGRWHITGARLHNIQQLIRSIKSNRTIYGKPVDSFLTAYIAMDRGNTGVLSREDFIAGLIRLGLGLSHEQLNDVVSLLDSSYSGNIDSEDFVNLLESVDEKSHVFSVTSPRRRNFTPPRNRDVTEKLVDEGDATPSPTRTPPRPSTLKSSGRSKLKDDSLLSSSKFRNSNDTPVKVTDLLNASALSDVIDGNNDNGGSSFTLDVLRSTSNYQGKESQEAVSSKVSALVSRSIRSARELTTTVSNTVDKVDAPAKEKAHIKAMLENNTRLAMELETAVKLLSSINNSRSGNNQIQEAGQKTDAMLAVFEDERRALLHDLESMRKQLSFKETERTRIVEEHNASRDSLTREIRSLQRKLGTSNSSLQASELRNAATAKTLATTNDKLDEAAAALEESKAAMRNRQKIHDSKLSDLHSLEITLKEKLETQEQAFKKKILSMKEINSTLEKENKILKKELDDKVANWEVRGEKLMGERSALTERLLDSERRVTIAERDAAAAHATIIKLTAEASRGQDSIAQLNEKLEDSRRNYKDQLNKLSSAHEISEKANRTLRKDVETLKEELIAERNTIKEMRSKFNRQAKEMQDAFSAQSSEKDTGLKQVQLLTKEIENLELSLGEETSKAHKLKQQLNEVRNDSESLIRRAIMAEDEKSKAVDELAAARDEITALKMKLSKTQSALAAEKEESSSTINELRNERDELERIHDDIQTQLVVLKREYAEERGAFDSTSAVLTKELSTSSAKIEELTLTLTNVEGDLIVSRRENKNLQRRLDAEVLLAEQNSVKYQERVKELEEVVASLDETKKSMEQQIRSLSRNVTALESEMNEVTAEAAKNELILQDELSGLKEDRDRLQKELEDIQLNYEDTNRDLNTVKKSIFKKESEKSDLVDNLRQEVRTLKANNRALDNKVAVLEAKLKAKPYDPSNGGDDESVSSAESPAKSSVEASLQHQITALQHENSNCLDEIAELRSINVSLNEKLEASSARLSGGTITKPHETLSRTPPSRNATPTKGGSLSTTPSRSPDNGARSPTVGASHRSEGGAAILVDMSPEYIEQLLAERDRLLISNTTLQNQLLEANSHHVNADSHPLHVKGTSSPPYSSPLRHGQMTLSPGASVRQLNAEIVDLKNTIRKLSDENNALSDKVSLLEENLDSESKSLGTASVKPAASPVSKTSSYPSPAKPTNASELNDIKLQLTKITAERDAIKLELSKQLQALVAPSESTANDISVLKAERDSLIELIESYRSNEESLHVQIQNLQHEVSEGVSERLAMVSKFAQAAASKEGTIDKATHDLINSQTLKQEEILNNKIEQIRTLQYELHQAKLKSSKDILLSKSTPEKDNGDKVALAKARSEVLELRNALSRAREQESKGSETMNLLRESLEVQAKLTEEALNADIRNLKEQLTVALEKNGQDSALLESAKERENDVMMESHRLNAEVEALRDQLRGALKDSDIGSSKTGNLESEAQRAILLAQTRSQLQVAATQIDNLKTQVLSLKQQAEDDAILIASLGSIDKAEGPLDALIREGRQDLSTVSVLAIKRSHQEALIDQLQQDKLDLNAALRNMHRDAQNQMKRVAKLEESIREQNDSMNQAFSDMSDLQQMLTSIRESNKALSVENNQLKDKLEKLNEEFHSESRQHEALVASLNRDRALLETTLESTQVDVADRNNQLDCLKLAFDDYQKSTRAEVGTLRENLYSARLQIDELKVKITIERDEASRAVEAWTSKVHLQSIEVEKLNHNLIEIREQYDKYVAEASERISMLTSQRNIFVGQIRQHEEKKTTMKMEMEAREVAVQQRIHELQNLLSLKEKEPLIEQYQSEIEALKRKLMYQEKDLMGLVNSMNSDKATLVNRIQAQALTIHQLTVDEQRMRDLLSIASPRKRAANNANSHDRNVTSESPPPLRSISMGLKLPSPSRPYSPLKQGDLVTFAMSASLDDSKYAATAGNTVQTPLEKDE